MNLSDQEFAILAARHGYGEDGNPRRTLNKISGKTREQEFKEAGIKSQQNAADLCYEVRTAPDTKCFIGAYGREVYANNRLNAIHISNDQKPEKSTLYINSISGLTASERIKEMAQEEKKENGIPCHMREGGSKALEQDRQAQQISQALQRPKDQKKIIDDALSKKQAELDSKLTPEVRRGALKEAETLHKDKQTVLAQAQEREPNSARKEQIALRGDIEKNDFERHAAQQRAKVASQESGPQSLGVLKAKRQGREADTKYDQEVALWHKRSVRDPQYERFDKKWSAEAVKASAREQSIKSSQKEKDVALNRQFDLAASKARDMSR